MKVGDLIRDKHTHIHNYGLIIYKDEHGDVNKYRVLVNNGQLDYLSRDYVETHCEIISENR